ncbi:Meiotic recombination protein SPO11 [Seminavis robusta]|uniref:DNA topoisomerase (ATP-hydrolyzing) n=1 Tax=Seminavis robusta TaxID=568900 RepID=A0A9N8DLW1_9STRA|nr:Meiotic recombination protein SPO11 [Seminavis robusta]|eukprot:Sro229_g092990.1 Meiotic recombination protein SPO11 (610) ;mRNA; f:35225-37139
MAWSLEKRDWDDSQETGEYPSVYLTEQSQELSQLTQSQALWTSQSAEESQTNYRELNQCPASWLQQWDDEDSDQNKCKALNDQDQSEWNYLSEQQQEQESAQENVPGGNFRLPESEFPSSQQRLLDDRTVTTEDEQVQRGEAETLGESQQNLEQPSLDVPPNDPTVAVEVDHNNSANSDQEEEDDQLLSPTEVIRRVESLTRTLVQALANGELPEMKSRSNQRRRFIFHNMTQCRAFSNILLVLAFCHNLLLSQRTTTTREVYYFYVTHFRSQRECDAAIVEAANLLRVPRSTLGLFASPKGWFCGCIQILREGRIAMDGKALSSIQGAPITQEWLSSPTQRDFTIDCLVDAAQAENEDDSSTSNTQPAERRRAKCVLVIEKEGVYTRLAEDRIFEKYPCILVTGKGFPDVATRSFVHTLHRELKIPVYGLADCNPYGALVINTYQRGSERLGMDGGSRYSVPIRWLGLMPSQVADIGSGTSTDGDDDMMDEEATSRSTGNRSNNPSLPPGVYQQLTDLDRKRLAQLLDEDHQFHGCGTNQDCYEELELMQENGYKVELESLNWLGMDFMSQWVHGALIEGGEQLAREQEEELQQAQDESDVDSHSQDM